MFRRFRLQDIKIVLANSFRVVRPRGLRNLGEPSRGSFEAKRSFEVSWGNRWTVQCFGGKTERLKKGRLFVGLGRL